MKFFGVNSNKNMDFTINKYTELIELLISKNYHFYTYNDFHLIDKTQSNRIVTLRHDVDKKKYNSLEFAKIQCKLGIKGTYYFRVVPESFDEKVIKEIASMGHEIGYHYETMDTSRGNIDKAYDEFCFYLEKFRQIIPVTTVCMHGSPLSKFDNRDIWKKYDYKNLGIIAEPYFDLDFNKVFYLTDTGRRWDGSNVSVRDKSMNSNIICNELFLMKKFHSTNNLINGINESDFPNLIMMTFHPQRWTNNRLDWTSELILQNLKNQIKKFIVK